MEEKLAAEVNALSSLSTCRNYELIEFPNESNESTKAASEEKDK